MSYRIMKAIVMFDLPMELDKQRREYRNFRKHLLELGFAMLQYSVYMKTCPNGEVARNLENKVKTKAPTDGNIRFLIITQKQFNDMKLIVGEKTSNEKVLGGGRILVI